MRWHHRGRRKPVMTEEQSQRRNLQGTGESTSNTKRRVIDSTHRGTQRRLVTISLVPRPSHVFQHAQEKSGMPGRFGDVHVMMTYLPPFLQTVAEMVEDTSHYRPS